MKTEQTSIRQQGLLKLKPMLFVFALMSLFCNTIYAQETQSPSLKSGMRYYDVLRHWGPPREKKVNEASRQEVWYYPDGEVLYLEGKVVAWSRPQKKSDTHAALAVVDSGSIAASVPRYGPNSDRNGGAEKVDEVLGEIMRELPEADQTGG